MLHAHRSTFAGVFLVLAAFLVAGCSGVATKSIEAERARLHREPLGLSAKGHPDASIDASGSVKIGPRHLDLTAGQQNAALLYRRAVIDLADLALDSASRSTRHIVMRSLFAAMTGREEAMERKIEDDTEAMVHGPAFCSHLETVWQRQASLVAAVAALARYLDLDRKEVENCRAGRPYKADL